ncbi:head-tail adaptor protein [Falsirhodobacter halotolerans]|uniref:head-tail adaptor protein n=1 Tax=Falsirhodobacter halotolerans TaxID=1146892 RepID=UPI001FD1833B|nr:head-tail adaptor protein [Falsirhodobacter halotolerans]MCJ8139568.1 head-tail adaptor protein [Falsirhodobacter halotolerans]
MIRAGSLNRRVQFLRSNEIMTPFASRPGEPTPFGGRVWASREDMSDAEKAAGDTVFSGVSARFVVRSNAFTREITTKDQLTEGGTTFDIVGIKEIGRREAIEITGVAREEA